MGAGVDSGVSGTAFRREDGGVRLDAGDMGRDEVIGGAEGGGAFKRPPWSVALASLMSY